MPNLPLLFSIPQISLGAAALIIFAACAGFVMLRGLTRMVVGTLALALSAWAAFLMWQTSPSLALALFGRSFPAVTVGLPLVTFIAALLVIRRILKFVSNPFGRDGDDEGGSGRSSLRMPFRLLASVIPAGVLCLVGATVLHHAGSIAEIRAFAEKSVGSSQNLSSRYLEDIKKELSALLPPSMISLLDPLAAPERVERAKAVAERSANPPPPPEIDPETGKPIPRAIVVDDPDLTNLARSGSFGDLLRHPVLNSARPRDPATR